ncbi:MAG: GspE/PulE family protein [Gemmiger sp.]|nr:GspE/PulE family protein [Gemmiger sp.]
MISYTEEPGLPLAMPTAGGSGGNALGASAGATTEYSAVQLLDTLLARAIAAGASDIHIEPFAQATAVRMRVDGMLLDDTLLPPALHPALLARVKILSDLDIAERRLPQDGHFSTTAGKTDSETETETDVRVSILPTLFGEKAVLRLLGGALPLAHPEHFGMDEAAYRRFLPLLNRPGGLLYLTGPTGSGKTTTLYLALEYLAHRQQNISTIEDPVERRLARVNQCQVNLPAGLTFEKGLRALLRQDPDILMVGETRDAETAAVSVRAAITGHKVLSTLHTNDALSAVVRLADMGIERYKIASAVSGLVAQRLLRRVCPQCRAPHPTTAAEAAYLGGVETVWRGAGCPHCNGTGYRGRVAIHEIVAVDAPLRQCIAAGANTDALAAQARQTQNFRTLRESALALVQSGITTPEEFLKVACLED